MANRASKTEYLVTINFVGFQTKQEQDCRQNCANTIQGVMARYLTENPPKEVKGEEDKTG